MSKKVLTFFNKLYYAYFNKYYEYLDTVEMSIGDKLDDMCFQIGKLRDITVEHYYSPEPFDFYVMIRKRSIHQDLEYNLSITITRDEVVFIKESNEEVASFVCDDCMVKGEWNVASTFRQVKRMVNLI